MGKINKQLLGRGTAFIYIQLMVSAISGYVFWIILSRLVDPTLVGTLSTIIALTEILANIAVIGTSDSIQRNLGRTLTEQRIRDTRVFVTASLLCIALGSIISGLLILFGGAFFELVENEPDLKSIIFLLVVSSTVRILLYSIVLSSLRTEILAVASIVSTTAKIVVSVILILSGAGIVGLSISYIFFGELLSSILLGIVTIRLLKSVPIKDSGPKISFAYAFKNILTGGVASWIPIVVTTLGYQLGTIVVFGSKGSSDTAVYFISLSLVNVILFGTNALASIALPALSSLEDARKRLAWQTIRWGYLVSVPLSSSLVFYSQEILRMFGESYIGGETILQILLQSVLPTIVANGVSTLVYAYGNYKQSLAIELVMGIPRIVLYFILIPIYGPIGGAISFTTGSLLALVVSIMIAHKIRMSIFWKDLVLVIIIPSIIGLILYALKINFLAGIATTLFASYFLLLKIGTITGSDLDDMKSILPHSISNPLSRLLKKLKQF
jgi:O-antigen/teichoic acid export membrane protein